MTNTTHSTAKQKKFFGGFLVLLALGGLYAMVAVPANIEATRNQNLAIVQAERAAFWEVHEQAAVTPEDAANVAFIAQRATKCHPATATTDLSETRKAFAQAETKCLRKLRTEFSVGNGYNRTVVLIDWAATHQS